MRVRNVKGADVKLAMFPDKVISNPNDYKGKWNNYFKNDNPIYIEIGMGKGKFILEHALRNPDINYIGIEKDISIVYKALVKYLETEEEKEVKLNNLVFLNIDACNIKEIFEDNEVNKVYLNFSDPWPKTRHEKRRLTSPLIFKNILDILNGELEFKTDNRKLFEYSVIEFNTMSLDIVELSLDLHSDKEDIITTEYEDKFVSKGNVIYYCKLKERE
jgi:tRNA (guanine-N7-)-methyltransferase